MKHLVHIPYGVTDSTLWVLLVLLAFLAMLVALNIPQKITKALDDRSAAIQQELEAARRLREEAQDVLAAYQKRQLEAEAEAKAIIEQARREAEVLAQTTRRELAERLERRTAMAEAKIAQAEADAMAEVQQTAAELAVQTASLVLSETLNTNNHRTLFQEGLDELKARL